MWEQLTKQEGNCVISTKWHPGIYPMRARGFPLCSACVRAGKSILIKYKYQSLLKQQQRDESSTWHLPQQHLATKLMCWRKASSAIMWQQLDTWPPSMKLFQFQRAHPHTEQMIRWSWECGGRGASWHVMKLHEFRASKMQLLKDHFLWHLQSIWFWKKWSNLIEDDADWVPASACSLLLCLAASLSNVLDNSYSSG